MKNIPIFFSCDDNYVPFLGVAITSLICNTSEKNNYNIYVLHSGLKNENMKRIKTLETQNASIDFVDVSDKLEAYGAGGDDYIVKPFSPKELLMKVTALVRRYNQYAGKELDGDAIALPCGVMIRPSKREVLKNGEVVDIRDKEFEVFLFLAMNKGRTVSAAEIYESVWGERALPSSNNTVTVHILNLRRKLEGSSSELKLIRTVWGRGYQID